MMRIKWSDMGVTLVVRPFHNFGLSVHNASYYDTRVIDYHPWSQVQLFLGPLLVTIRTGLLGSNAYKGE